MDHLDTPHAGPSADFRKKVADRLGLVPNFFCSAQAAPGLIERLWSFAESAYFDNPLPSVFKERLFVHLSRFCQVRYCIIRHVGFLVGQGRPAGDPTAALHTVPEVIDLLSRPALRSLSDMDPVLSRLKAAPIPGEIPERGSLLEYDLFLAASGIFLDPERYREAGAAIRVAIGERNAEFLIAFIAFIRTAHYWTETHPEIGVEEDMQELMRLHEPLLGLLLSTSDADQFGGLGQRLYEEVSGLVRAQTSQWKSLQKSEEQFRRLVEGVTDYAIFMLDPSGVVASWNAGARRIKGYAPHEIIGKHFSIFYSADDRAAAVPQKALETAARVGRYEVEGWRYRKDGSRFWAHIIIDRILDESDQLLGFAKITRDMTEQREAQIALEKARDAMAQSQKMDAIGQLTGGVAHDFNNLLMAVLGSLELLGRRLPDDPKLRMLLNNAFEGARRGVTLSQRMLSFARRRELSLSAVDVKGLVDGMRDLLDRSLGPMITVETEITNGLPCIKADANQLETSILNLALNSRDAMPRGGIIHIRARLEKCGDIMGSRAITEDCVVLSVSDTGEGMDELTLRRAMEPFFTTKGLGKGTGLGLSMVHGMTEQLGGRLRLASRLGQGTTVELWLPIAEGVTLAKTPIDVLRAESPKGSIRKLVILVVDDDSLVLTNTSAMLQDAGHMVIEASSGPQALERIRSALHVDLLITDQAMPQMTGLQLAAAARVEWPEMPILLVSGYAELPTSDLFKLPTLAKPYSLDDLRRAVNALTSSDGASATIASSYRDS
jgi:PAS domain S-box-containing protein